MFRADPEGAARPGGSSVGCSVGNRGGGAVGAGGCRRGLLLLLLLLFLLFLRGCAVCGCVACRALQCAVTRLCGCAGLSLRQGRRPFRGACGLSALSPVPHLRIRFSPNGRPLELAGRCGLQFFACGSGFWCFLPSEVRRGLSDKFFDPLKIAYWEKFSNSSMNRKGLSKIC